MIHAFALLGKGLGVALLLAVLWKLLDWAGSVALHRRRVEAFRRRLEF